MSSRIIDQLTSAGNLSGSSKSVRNHRNNSENFKNIEDYPSSFLHSDIVLEKLVTASPHLFTRLPGQHVVLTTQEKLSDEEKALAMQEFSFAASSLPSLSSVYCEKKFKLLQLTRIQIRQK